MNEIVDYARTRYLNDAEFHAKVDTAVGLVGERIPLTEQERELATISAAVGLAMQWVDTMTGRIFDD